MADVPKHLLPLRSALVAELQRQAQESGPYGALHYLSVNDEGEAHVEGAINIDALVLALAQADPARSLLRSCLGDYGHSNFTDRHGMAPRIRTVLGVEDPSNAG